MWLFTQVGYLSIVQKRGDRKLCVRARRRSDLDRFRETYCKSMTPTIATPSADYGFRAYIGRKALINAMRRVVKDIIYDNFKSQVAKVQGYDSTGPYHDVWSATRKMTDKKPSAGGGRGDLFSPPSSFGSRSLPPATPRGWQDSNTTGDGVEFDITDDDRDIPPADPIEVMASALSQEELEEIAQSMDEAEREDAEWLARLKRNHKDK